MKLYPRADIAVESRYPQCDYRLFWNEANLNFKESNTNPYNII